MHSTCVCYFSSRALPKHTPGITITNTRNVMDGSAAGHQIMPVPVLARCKSCTSKKLRRTSRQQFSLWQRTKAICKHSRPGFMPFALHYSILVRKLGYTRLLVKDRS
ncbi:predicted protein [Histoplasma capsulatum var. duboisii H88]|uniref:Predicted protein n=2 Tax=Ajellomyces capsulatus TaxID=5037 RepID=F0UNV6_AJEC8|nr:predicted protein [Histoplasma capsulatum H143]EGC47660.1 predicted protein [Histoplasma capsulatum var. duboisii H88]